MASTTHQAMPKLDDSEATADTAGTNLSTALHAAYIRAYKSQIEKGLKSNQALYALRAQHVPIIWKTVAEQLLNKGSFPGFTKWYEGYSKIHLSNQTKTGKTWFKTQGPKIHQCIHAIVMSHCNNLTIISSHSQVLTKPTRRLRT